MSEVTVKQFADVVGMPLDRLLNQLGDAGLSSKHADDTITDNEKLQLLSHLRHLHGKRSEAPAEAEPKKITLKRKTVNELRVPTGQGKKTVSVEVRAKRTYVKRSVAEEEQRHTDEALRERIEAAHREVEEALRRKEESHWQNKQAALKPPETELTVQQFADVQGIPLAFLLNQLEKAGLSGKSAGDDFSDKEQSQLESYLLRHRRGKDNAPQDELEGLDESNESVGWDEYPLDSVFVRTEPRSVSEVIKRIKSGRYELNPEFQRNFVWSLYKQSRLIESCLMRIPLPVFYVAEAKDGHIIVVDGLQRLTTFTRFINNEFALAGLAPPLMGKRFSDLPINLQERIEDTLLTLYVLDAKAPERAKLDIFERVNGGVPLTRQQMRNCLYNGKATQWLRTASETNEFITATGGTLDKKSMRDREAINRFCAFKLLGIENYKGDMEKFLAAALDAMNQMPESELDELMKSFINSMSINIKLFNDHAFRRSLVELPKRRSVINMSMFDVFSVIFSDKNAHDIIQNSHKVRQSVVDLLTLHTFIESITYSTNGLKQVSTRFKLANDKISEAIKC